jgi:hypothetical protein
MVVAIVIVTVVIVTMKAMNVTRASIRMALSATERHRIMTMIVMRQDLAAMT